MSNLMRYCLIVIGCFLFIPMSLASDELDEIRKSYNKAILSKDCSTALKRLDEITKIEPNEGYQIKASLYQNGICLKQNYEKALENYLKVSKDEIQSINVLHIKNLQFILAQSSLEKNEIISGLREDLYEQFLSFNNTAQVSSYLSIVFKDYPAFWTKLSAELEYFYGLENDSDLMFSEVERLLEENKYRDVAKKWLSNLSFLDNTRGKAKYLWAIHFEKDVPFSFKHSMQHASWHGYSKAQVIFARLSAQGNNDVENRRALYWYKVAIQNGEPVQEEMEEFKKTLPPFDIEFVEYQLSRGNESTFRID